MSEALKDQMLDVLRAEVAQARRERDEARDQAVKAEAEAERLGRENDELCDQVFELQQRLAKLEGGKAA